MDTHIKIVGILHIIYGLLGCMIALGMLVLFGGISTVVLVSSQEMLPVGVLGIIGGIVVFLTLVSSIPGLIGGWGLTNRHWWARILLIVVSVFYILSGILSFPLGILSIGLALYTLIVLFSNETVALLH